MIIVLMVYHIQNLIIVLLVYHIQNLIIVLLVYHIQNLITLQPRTVDDGKEALLVTVIVIENGLSDSSSFCFTWERHELFSYIPSYG